MSAREKTRSADEIEDATFGHLHTLLDLMNENGHLWDRDDRDMVHEELRSATSKARKRTERAHKKNWAACKKQLQFDMGDDARVEDILERVVEGRMAIIAYVVDSTSLLDSAPGLVKALAKKQADLIEILNRQNERARESEEEDEENEKEEEEGSVDE